MNRSELVETLAPYFDGNRTEATRALNAVVHAVSSATAAGERVAITGFGVFERVERPARTVRNPRTGERLDVAATAVPRFRAGTELKAYVSGQRAVPDFGSTPSPRRTPSAAPPTPIAEPVEALEATQPKPKANKVKKPADKPKKSEGKKADEKKAAAKKPAARKSAAKPAKKGKGKKK